MRTELAAMNTTGTWSTGCYTAVEHRFRVLVDSDPTLRPFLEPVLAPLRTTQAGAVDGTYRVVRRERHELPYVLYFDDERLTIASCPQTVVRMLVWHINRSAISRSAGRHVLLHAAAATRAGVTVMLPAQPESGKTTTVAGLLREGYGYVSDEMVALDPETGAITPFPKALSIDEGAWHLFPECRPTGLDDTAPWLLPAQRQWQVPAGRLGAGAPPRRVPPPRVIAFPRYTAGGATHCSPATRAQAVHEMARSTFCFPANPARNLTALARVATNATTVRLHIGDLDDAVSAIEALVSQTLQEAM